MTDYSEEIIKEPECNYKGYRRYKTTLFIIYYIESVIHKKKDEINILDAYYKAKEDV